MRSEMTNMGRRLLMLAWAGCISLGVMGALSVELKPYPIMGELGGHQQEPVVAMGPDGGVMVWHHQANHAGSRGRLVVQRINKGGVGIGVPVPLSGSDFGVREMRPQVALLLNGGAVVAWESGPKSNRDVRLRFLSANGLFTSEVKTANTFTEGDQFQPALAALRDGSVMVAWVSNGQDNSGNGVFGQRFTALGAAMGREIRLNENIEMNQSQPALAPLSDGRFVGVWISESMEGKNETGAPNLRGHLVGRFYGANGMPAAGEFRINSMSGLCSRPVVAALGDGFVAAWEKRDEVEMMNQTDIFVRSFGRNGLPTGMEARWNAYKAGRQGRISLATQGGDGLLVWESEVRATLGREIHGRMLSGGAEFRVNERVKYHQQQPAVVSLGQGGFLVTWVDFVKSNNAILTAVQYGSSSVGDLTKGAHVSYQETGTKPLVLTAHIETQDDPVGAAIENQVLEQQLAVEFSADEKTRQAAVVAQAAAAVKASGLLQQMAAKAPAATAVGGLSLQSGGIRRTPMGFASAAAPAQSLAQTPSIKAGREALESVAQASLHGTRVAPTQPMLRTNFSFPRPVQTQTAGNSYRTPHAAPLPSRLSRAGLLAQPGRSLRGMRLTRPSAVTQRTASPHRPLVGGSSMTSRRVNTQGLATVRSQLPSMLSQRLGSASDRYRNMTQRTPMQPTVRRNVPVSASLVQGRGNYQLQWRTQVGARYQVQKSRDSQTWMNEGPVRRGTGRAVQSPVGSGGSYRFYRVIKTQ
ncbi:MAG: hypothetical protein CMO74_11385 [Verrucomicrobiales bacterium]|nr:hypothetical protein [Verrucomicrobiales bacterium]